MKNQDNPRQQASQVFRQFAWNLASTLAVRPGTAPPRGKAGARK